MAQDRNNGAKLRAYNVRLGPQGRLVIPVVVRTRLGLRQGDTLLLRVRGRTVLLETRETVLARAKSWFKDIPYDISLVDDLLADRRAAAEQEESE